MTRGMRLPAQITGHDLICVTLKIPDDPLYRAAFLGVLQDLQRWHSWERTGGRHGAEAAQYWRELLFDYLQIGVQMITNIRIQNGVLEVQYCNDPAWYALGTLGGDCGDCAPAWARGYIDPVGATIPAGGVHTVTFSQAFTETSPPAQVMAPQHRLSITADGVYTFTGRVRVSGAGRVLLQIMRQRGGQTDTVATTSDNADAGSAEGITLAAQLYALNLDQYYMQITNATGGSITLQSNPQLGEFVATASVGVQGPAGPAGPGAAGPGAPMGGVLPPGIPSTPAAALPPNSDELCNAAYFVAARLVELIQQVLADAQVITLDEFLGALLGIGGFKRSLVKQLWDLIIASTNPDLGADAEAYKADLAAAVLCGGFMPDTVTDQVNSLSIPAEVKAAYIGALGSVDESRLALWVTIGAYTPAPAPCVACPAQYQLDVIDGAYFDTLQISADESLLLCTPYWRHSLSGKWLQEFEAEETSSGFYVASGTWGPYFVVGYLPFGADPVTGWVWAVPPPDVRIERIRWYWNSEVSYHTPVEDIELPAPFDEMRTWLHVVRHSGV